MYASTLRDALERLAPTASVAGKGEWQP